MWQNLCFQHTQSHESILFHILTVAKFTHEPVILLPIVNLVRKKGNESHFV